MDLSLTFQHLKNLENVDFKIDDFQIKNAEKKGIHLYKNDELLRDIATFMEHPENQNFYKKYFSDIDTFKAILSLMKIYEIISIILEKNGLEFNAYHKIYVLYLFMKNPLYSRIINKGSVNSGQKLIN
jgi:hypothetical protein